MNTILFSHHYPKLHGQRYAELLAIRPIRIDRHTPRQLLDYDTTYDGGYYRLSTGNYLLLVFLGNYNIPFTTIRKAFPISKMRYYLGRIGQTFQIQILQETDHVKA